MKVDSLIWQGVLPPLNLMLILLTLVDVHEALLMVVIMVEMAEAGHPTPIVVVVISILLPNKKLPTISDLPVKFASKQDVVLQYWHRFDHNYQYAAPTSFFVNFTSPTSLSDSTWYPNSAATQHITHDFTNLNLSSKPYSRNEQTRVEDGSGFSIQNTDDSSLSSPSSSFLLRNLLHVPSITKNLISVSQFCRNNFCYFEFHENFFSMKDISIGTSSQDQSVMDFMFFLPLQRLLLYLPPLLLLILA